MRCIAVGRIRQFRDGFKHLTPQREYIYMLESGYFDEGFMEKEILIVLMIINGVSGKESAK